MLAALLNNQTTTVAASATYYRPMTLRMGRQAVTTTSAVPQVYIKIGA